MCSQSHFFPQVTKYSFSLMLFSNHSFLPQSGFTELHLLTRLAVVLLSSLDMDVYRAARPQSAKEVQSAGKTLQRKAFAQLRISLVSVKTLMNVKTLMKTFQHLLSFKPIRNHRISHETILLPPNFQLWNHKCSYLDGPGREGMPSPSLFMSPLTWELLDPNKIFSSFSII